MTIRGEMLRKTKFTIRGNRKPAKPLYILGGRKIVEGESVFRRPLGVRSILGDGNGQYGGRGVGSRLLVIWSV